VRYPEDKIKEAILHPDLDVRDRSIRYFYDSTNLDHTFMPLAIEAIEKYGRTKAFSFTHYLNCLPQTQQTIGWVIAELQRDFDGLPEEKYFYFLNLSRLLYHADIRQVAQRAPEIFHARNFDPKERLAFRERLEMFGWNAEKCWQALQQHCEANKDKNNIEEFDLGHVVRIIEALARKPHEYQGQIVAILSEKVDDFRHDPRKWLLPLMAKLAGQMRLQAAIPLLVGYLGHPYRFLSDQSMFALAKIGSEKVVALVCDQFSGASKNFRLYASDLLCKIHLDVTIQRVLEVLPGETELAIQMNLCEALIDHFSSEGIEPARQLIKQHELTPDLRRLRSSLIATCKIMETRFPEFNEWQEEARKDTQDEWAKVQKIQRMAFEAGGDLGNLVQKMQAQIVYEQAKIKTLKAEAAEKETRLAGKASPRLRVAGPDDSSSRKPNRIGRNDRCPCGSGKKFKTCCMRK
jgi:SEC-C motif-containing protein